MSIRKCDALQEMDASPFNICGLHLPITRIVRMETEIIIDGNSETDYNLLQRYPIEIRSIKSNRNVP